MALTGGFMFVRNPQRFWALAFAVAAVSRLVVTTSYLAVRLLFAVRGVEFGGTPNFDEHNIAAALGFSPVVASIAATSLLILLLVWQFRQVERSSRLLFAPALVLAIGMGNIAWTALAPPVLATAG
jgi:hypothetical protein